jgi:hypothetical protein
MGKKCCYTSCCPPPCCPPIYNNNCYNQCNNNCYNQCNNNCYNPCNNNCYNPCNPCPIYPICPPCFPCNPCLPYCPPYPCGPCDTNGCYPGPDQCCTKYTDFLGQSSNPLGPFSVPTTQTLIFNKVRDSGCDYDNNNTFNARCKGEYNFCVSVPVEITGTVSTVQLQLTNASGVVRASTSTTTSGTLIINACICVDKCESIFVNLVITGTPGDFEVSIPATVRSFSGTTYCKKSCY